MTTTLPAPATTPTVPATPGLDATALVGRLRTSFESGRTRSYEWRRDQLQAMRRMLTEREPELFDALAADMGKPGTEAYAADVGFVVAELDYTLKRLRHWMRPKRVHAPLVTKPASARIMREPLGVVLVIAPWNYPVHLQLAPMVGAIAAGNCVVAKPSEVTANTSALLARLIPEYLDTECVAVVEGAVAETQALLAEPFDYIFYTGNGTVGRVVMAAAAKHLTPVTLELGGKSPVIVDETANLEVAARRVAWGKFLNAGQTCIAPDYVLVAKPVADRFVEHVRRAIFDFYGPDPKDSPDYARIVDARHWKRLVGLLKSGTAAIGGQSDEATRYLAPTVLRDVAPDSPAMQDEIFGPVLPVLTVDSVDEAISFVNKRDKPLALYLFSGSKDVQQRVLEQTSSGGACVNATMFHVAVPSLPFGGVGPSGQGAYHGRSTFETFSHAKSVLRKSARPDPALAYPPYTERKDKLLRRFLVSPRLPDGWGPTTPRDDTLTREFVEAYADLMEGLGRAGGHPTMRTPDFVALDSHAPFPFLNYAVPLRPVVDASDPMLDEITAFFAPDDGTPFLVYSATAMPPLEARGWSLMGHPPFMLRPAGPATPPEPEGLEIVEVRDAATVATFDQTLIEAYPVDAMRGRRGFADGVLDIPGFRMWLGLLDGAPVATAAAHVTDTLVDVEWISAMPAARGRRIGEALTWAATLAAPELPAMLIASDLGQPIYERMGYLRMARFTLWIGRRA